MPGKSHGRRRLVGYSPWGCKESDTTEQLHFTSYLNGLNQVPYNYTVEVTNRFKGLDLIDRVPVYYGWRFITLYRRP